MRRLYFSLLYMEVVMVICNFSFNNIFVFIWVWFKVCYVLGCKMKLYKYEEKLGRGRCYRVFLICVIDKWDY